MMRRPLMYLTLALAAGITIAYHTDAAAAFLILGGTSVFFLLKNRKGTPLNNAVPLILMGFCLGITSLFVSESKDGFFAEVSQHSGVMKARVLQIEERENQTTRYVQIKAKVLEWEGNPVKNRESVLIRYYGKAEKSETIDTGTDEMHDDIVPGDVLTVKGTLSEPEGQRNPGCFDYALYLKSIGIRSCMAADDIELWDGCGKDTIEGRLFRIRERFLDRLEASAGVETAALMRGIMFGEKTCMEEELLEAFQKNGTAHVLAVSGLHVGMIYAFISLLWRWKKRYLFSGVVMAFFLCYMVMASFSPSVVRAVFMVGLHLLAKLLNRRYDMSSAAFFMASIMLLKNPLQLFHTGFQMSFLAVLTMSLILPIVRRFYDGLLLASISVQIGLLPYTMYVFNYLSLAAVMVNVPVIFLTGVIVPAGLCSMAVMELCEPVFDLISGVIFGLCHMLMELNGATGIDGITVFDVVSPPLWAVALYYLILLFFISEEGRLVLMRRGKCFFVRMGIMVMAAACVFGMMAGSGFKKADIIFVDVGQGDCMHIKTEDAGSYLIDGGGSINYDLGKKTLKPYLLKNGVRRVEGAFITHLHTDHYKGIAELCRQGMVERLFLYEGNRVKEQEILRETGLAKEQLTYLYKGQTVKLGKEATVQVLWPERGTARQYAEALEREEDENASSMILRADVKGCSLLATADVDGACLDMLAEEWNDALKSDILKVPHHGSKYSSSESFTEAASPHFAVFQVGENNFGHPDKGVVENYREKGIMVYRNDEDGAVGFDVTRNGNIHVMTVRRP